jgi:hypothetical protein
VSTDVADDLAAVEEPYLVDVDQASEEQEDLAGLCPILRTRAGDPLPCLLADCRHWNPGLGCELEERVTVLRRAGA